MALPIEVWGGASSLPILPVSTRTACRASRTASTTTELPCKAARCTVSPVAWLMASMYGSARRGRSTCRQAWLRKKMRAPSA